MQIALLQADDEAQHRQASGKAAGGPVPSAAAPRPPAGPWGFSGTDTSELLNSHDPTCRWVLYYTGMRSAGTSVVLSDLTVQGAGSMDKADACSWDVLL